MKFLGGTSLVIISLLCLCLITGFKAFSFEFNIMILSVIGVSVGNSYISDYIDNVVDNDK